MNLRFLLLASSLCTWKFCVCGNESGTNIFSENIEKEYCLNEDFYATCLKNEMIAIDRATYGRMRTGRCLKGSDFHDLLLKDPNFIGCSVDVTHLMNEKCFGKTDCTIQLLYDIDQKVIKPCLSGLENYLIARYRCISVVQADRSCKVPITTTPQHFQMTPSASKSGLQCGQRHQPWIIETKPGQQIEVGIFYFPKVKEIINQHDCLEYGYIIDREANKNISVCGLRSGRDGPLYQSKSNELELFITAPQPEKDGLNVLISAQALGCTSMVPPEDMWLRRRNQETVVGCYSSRQTWYLNCVNNQWLGVIGNCTREPAAVLSEVVTDSHKTVNMQVLVSVVIVFIGLIICVVIVVCGVVCIKRYNEIIQRTKYNHMAEGPINAKLQNELRSQQAFGI